MGRSVVHPPVEDDPVATALNNEEVGRRLMAAAIAFLMPRLNSPRQRQAVAEEIVAIVRARAWEKRSTFDSNKDACAWLVGFVINVCRERLKQAKRESVFFSPIQLEHLAADVDGRA